MIKNYIKRTWPWKIVSRSNLYQRMRFPEDYKKRQLEPNFYKRFLRSHPSKDNLIFDVGANVGHKSMVFSKLAKQVVAFEPSESLFGSLKQRFENTNVQVIQCALGSTVGEREFYVVENNEAYNSLNKKHLNTTVASRGIATAGSIKMSKVKVDVIENFISSFGKPKYIKIDVEGYEYEVIKKLRTPVPLLSFEVNLPEFLEEALQSIDHLDQISAGNYSFNYSTGIFFLEKKFQTAAEAKAFLKGTELEYLEVYTKLGRTGLD